MNDLLSLDRWNTVTSVEIAASITGAIWHVKSKPDVLKSVVRDDFATEEIAPVEADGETWRRLKVTFPDTVKSHVRVEVACLVRVGRPSCATGRARRTSAHPGPLRSRRPPRRRTPA